MGSIVSLTDFEEKVELVLEAIEFFNGEPARIHAVVGRCAFAVSDAQSERGGVSAHFVVET